MTSPSESTAAVDPASAPALAPILFRANKKRKVGLRQRAASPDSTAIASSSSASPKTTPLNVSNAAVPTTSAPDAVPAADDETESHIPSALRHRSRKRLNGVGFSARGSTVTAAASTDETDPLSSTSSSRALVTAVASPPEDEPLIAKRFAPQTGTAAATIVNKHMMEYIESHLSNRKSPAAQPTTNPPPLASTVSHTSASAPSSAPPPPPAADPDPKNHPIMQGKLMEVDLGDEVRARNQAMTEKAARRLLGEVDSADADNPDGRRAKKPRLGRDGKPWRSRNRRNSDDIKRDQLVEEILRENRLDVYDVPKTQQPQYEGDGDADDRIAEEFRREFMDAMVQRQQKKKTAAAPARAGARKADEEVLKGPKLGGSRNARAAMRDLLLKKEKEKESRR
ncbi:mrna splicing factor rna helicase [Colletotrichum incanum]|uniref:Mrna splicing factor rna helicase n=1 Tax=Colletotrichum incanum TaxID=1573173 RepID=A0A161VZG8_COLIC|nr:mrna splicing factor rna helicase [Colletotrichum incanum]